MRARHRGRGFSLVEILISLGLAGLIVAGALQIHATFNQQSRNQNAISDLQQTLRVALEIVERAVRSAGSGMVGGRMSLKNCTGTQTLSGFRFYNNNAFPLPTIDSTMGGNDPDPDQFTVIAAERDSPVSIGNVAPGATSVNLFVMPPGALPTWLTRDLVLLVKSTPAPNDHCLREVTAIAGSVVSYNTGSPQYPCANDPPDCTAGGIARAPARHFRDELNFRVFPGVAPDPPRLAMRRARINDTVSTAWEVIVENIEDMQIALIMNDGRICNSVDDPALCNPSLAKAARITLVGRTANIAQGTPPSTTGGYEDRPAVVAVDNYIRRAVTAEVQLRN